MIGSSELIINSGTFFSDDLELIFRLHVPSSHSCMGFENIITSFVEPLYENIPGFMLNVLLHMPTKSSIRDSSSLTNQSWPEFVELPSDIIYPRNLASSGHMAGTENTLFLFFDLSY